MLFRIFLYLALLSGTFCYSGEKVPFSRLMAIQVMRSPLLPKDRSKLKKFALDYKKKIKYLKKKDLNTIPRKIHFIWLGPRPFPEVSTLNVISWQKLHPNWEIFFWTDNAARQVPVPGMIKRVIQNFDFGAFTPLIAKSDNWGEKSDLMRIIILLKEGGLYTDHDITCLQSWEPFRASYDYVSAFQRLRTLSALHTKVTPEISLILSRPGHPILKKMMTAILKNWDSASAKFAGPDMVWKRVIHHTYMHFADTTMKNHYSRKFRNIILPASYIYLYKIVSDEELSDLEKEGYVYALHEGAGEWVHHRN